MIAAWLLLLQAAPADGPLLLKDARVVSAAGPERPKASVLVVDGKIAKIGEALEAPANARVVDLAGKVLLPGLVDAGGRLALEEAPNALEPGAPSLRRAALCGVTTAYAGPGNRNVVGGTGAVVKTAGPERYRALRARADLKTALGSEPSSGNYSPRGTPATFYARRPTTRMGVVWEFRKAFADARDGRLPEGEGASLTEALAGKLPVRVAASKATDVETATSLAAEFGLSIVLEDAQEAWKLAEVLGRLKIPVILRPVFDAGSADARADALSRLRAAGVEVALAAPAAEPESLLAAAAFAVRHGASREEALRAVTAVPARILGVADRVGTIEEGRDADLVAFSGDPLDPRSTVERVWVGGRLVAGGK
jgi:imidazolonepropionase-like amidohydrolase